MVRHETLVATGTFAGAARIALRVHVVPGLAFPNVTDSFTRSALRGGRTAVLSRASHEAERARRNVGSPFALTARGLAALSLEKREDLHPGSHCARSGLFSCPGGTARFRKAAGPGAQPRRGFGSALPTAFHFPERESNPHMRAWVDGMARWSLPDRGNPYRHPR
jgi:hypothetical protein